MSGVRPGMYVLWRRDSWGVNLTARALNHSDRYMVERGGGIVGRTRNSAVGRGDAPRKKGFRAGCPDPA
jgi:hypothetical protein